MAASAITDRAFEGWPDVLGVHEFLTGAMAVTRCSRVWEVRRWEGRWWHDDPAAVEASLDRATASIRIWEDTGGTIVAVAHPEGRGDVHLQVLEEHADLEDDMLAWAESSPLPLGADDGTRSLLTFALADDAHRIETLERRGYERLDWGEIHRRRSLGSPLPPPPATPGYEVRAIIPGDRPDAASLAALINAAFGHAFGPEALLNFERAPSFVADCQIVAVADDGTHAAHAGVSIDAHNRLAIVEPVCTHPDHRRRGLAAACMVEGLRRARDRGATVATVSTGTENPSNHLYERLGFTDVERVDAWRRVLP